MCIWMHIVSWMNIRCYLILWSIFTNIQGINHLNHLVSQDTGHVRTWTSKNNKEQLSNVYKWFSIQIQNRATEFLIKIQNFTSPLRWNILQIIYINLVCSVWERPQEIATCKKILENIYRYVLIRNNLYSIIITS